MDESNGTCGKRLDSIGVENTEDNRRSYRELLVTTPGLGEYISGAILFEETLYQSCSTGKTMVEEMNAQGIIAGIKVRCVVELQLLNDCYTRCPVICGLFLRSRSVWLGILSREPSRPASLKRSASVDRVTTAFMTVQ